MVGSQNHLRWKLFTISKTKIETENSYLVLRTASVCFKVEVF